MTNKFIPFEYESKTKKLGEYYKVVYTENQDGTFESETMKLVEKKKYKGKTIYIFLEESGYTTARYNYSNPKEIDWDFLEEINFQF